MRWLPTLLASCLIAGCGGDEFEGNPASPQADAGADQAQVPDAAVDTLVQEDGPLADAEGGGADADASEDPDAAPPDASEEPEAGPPATLETDKPSVDFSETWVFSTSSTVKVAVTNTNPNAAAVSGALSVSLDNEVDFELSEDHCTGKTLQGQASCELYVAIRPAHTGALSAKLIILADPGGTASVSLNGTGKSKVKLEKDGYSQWPALTKVGASSEGQFFLLNNTADQVTSLQFTITPPGPPFEFVMNTCVQEGLGPNGSCHPHVRFTPTAQGTFKGTLRVVAPEAGGGEVPFEFVAEP